MLEFKITGSSWPEIKKKIAAVLELEEAQAPEPRPTEISVASLDGYAPLEAIPDETPAATSTAPPTPESSESPEVDDDMVDADGLPWDERIHAGTQTKTADGRWKRKRGVDQTLVDQVVAELKGEPEPAAPAMPAALMAQAPAPVDAGPYASVTDAAKLAELLQKAYAAGTSFDVLLADIKELGYDSINVIPADQFPTVAATLGTKYGVAP